MENKSSDNRPLDRHLTDDQWIECLLGEQSAEVVGHLSACPACRAELSRFRTATGQLARQTLGYAEALPEPFWQEQRRLIAARVAAGGARKTEGSFSRRLAFGLTAAAVALLAVILLRWSPPSRPSAGAPLSSADDPLLAQVQEALDREVPMALAPAALLTDEIERGIDRSQAR